MGLAPTGLAPTGLTSTALTSTALTSTALTLTVLTSICGKLEEASCDVETRRPGASACRGHARAATRSPNVTLCCMKAIRVNEFGGPEVMRIEDVPRPVPGAGQVRVAVHAAGVNPVDAYIRTGTYAFKPSLPYTPGSDAAGIVDAVGDGVSSVRLGDRVFVAAFGAASTGTYAEQVVADAGLIHPLGDDLTFSQGAAVGVPCVTAWRALFQKGHAQASRDRAGPRRQRRRRHRRRAARRGGWARRAWHRRHGRRTAARQRRGRDPCVRSQRRGLPRGHRRTHRRSRPGPRDRDAGQRQPRTRSGAPGQARAHRDRRQPRRARAQPARDHGQGRPGHGHDAARDVARGMHARRLPP